MGAYEHFGSATDVVDYETKITAFHFTGEFLPDDAWTFSFQGTVTLSDASFDAPEMETPEEVVHIGDYDFSGIPTYSDLDFREISLTARASRTISENTSGFVTGGWHDLIDYEPYTYGSMSGTVLTTGAGIETRF